MNRKYLLVCMAVSVALGLGACSRNDDDSESSSSQPTAVPSSVPIDPSPTPDVTPASTPTPTLTPTQTPNPMTTLSGFVIDPAVGAAVVCLDVDGNADCNGDEVTGTTDDTGYYEIEVETADANVANKIAKIVANTSYEVSTGVSFSSNFSFMAGPGDGNLTALTTYVEFLVNIGAGRADASQAAINAFGLTIGVASLGEFDPSTSQLSDITNRVLSIYIAEITEAALATISDLSPASAFLTALNHINVNIASIIATINSIDTRVIQGEDKEEILADFRSGNIVVPSDVFFKCENDDESCQTYTEVTICCEGIDPPPLGSGGVSI